MDVSLSFFLSFSPFFDNCSSTVIKPQRFLWGDGTGLSPQMYVNVGRRRTVRLGLWTPAKGVSMQHTKQSTNY